LRNPVNHSLARRQHHAANHHHQRNAHQQAEQQDRTSTQASRPANDPVPVPVAIPVASRKQRRIRIFAKLVTCISICSQSRHDASRIRQLSTPNCSPSSTIKRESPTARAIPSLARIIK
jgi:hypothetical protein